MSSILSDRIIARFYLLIISGSATFVLLLNLIPVVTRLLTSSLLLPLIIISWLLPLTARSDMDVNIISTDTIRPCESKDSLYIESLLKAGVNSSLLAQKSIDTLRASKNVFWIRIKKDGVSSFTPYAGSGSRWWLDFEIDYPTGAKDKIGTGGVLCFNPGYGDLITTAGIKRDTLMNFLHELLGHGWMANYGLMRHGKLDSLSYSEWQATHFENKLRAAAGRPLRLYYNIAYMVDMDSNKIDTVGKRPLLLKDGKWSLYFPCYNYLTKSFDSEDSCILVPQKRRRSD